MGVRDLNQYLRRSVSKRAIHRIELKDLSKKTIAIDTSIYMYRFLEKGDLVGLFEEMLQLFEMYEIVPIFVFDGKPPEEKEETLKNRSKEKEKAEQQYKELELQLQVMGEGTAKKEIEKEMKDLKANFIRVKKSDIKKVKTLFEKNNISFYEAPNEADVVIAYLANTGKVWGVLSDDMDFFLYGCDNVIRYLKLSSKSATLYNTKQILKDLNVSLKDFREVTVLAGTDYNLDDKRELKLHEIWELYYRFREEFSRMSFYKWLETHKHMKKIDIDRLNQIVASFDVYNNIYYQEHAKEIRAIKIENPWS